MQMHLKCCVRAPAAVAATTIPMCCGGLGCVGVMVLATLVVIGDAKLFCSTREHFQCLLGPFFMFLGAVIIIGGLSPHVGVV